MTQATFIKCQLSNGKQVDIVIDHTGSEPVKTSKKVVVSNVVSLTYAVSEQQLIEMSRLEECE